MGERELAECNGLRKREEEKVRTVRYDDDWKNFWHLFLKNNNFFNRVSNADVCCAFISRLKKMRKIWKKWSCFPPEKRLSLLILESYTHFYRWGKALKIHRAEQRRQILHLQICNQTLTTTFTTIHTLIHININWIKSCVASKSTFHVLWTQAQLKICWVVISFLQPSSYRKKTFFTHTSPLLVGKSAIFDCHCIKFLWKPYHMKWTLRVWTFQ